MNEACRECGRSYHDCTTFNCTAYNGFNPLATCQLYNSGTGCSVRIGPSENLGFRKIYRGQFLSASDCYEKFWTENDWSLNQHYGTQKPRPSKRYNVTQEEGSKQYKKLIFIDDEHTGCNLLDRHISIYHFIVAAFCIMGSFLLVFVGTDSTGDS